MSNRPNIFDYATSELSQDAFFAWLLEWAEDGYAQTEPQLHMCAFKLLETFFKKYYDNFHDKLVDKDFNGLEELKKFSNVEKIKSVYVNRQEKHIDLLLTIETEKNGDYYIIIEDKTLSGIHGEQLKNYRNNWLKDDEKKKRTCFIYLKTGTMDENEKKQVKKSKYSLFDLNDIYALLKGYKSLDSEIFDGYFFKLETVYYFNQFINEFDSNPSVKHYRHGVWKNHCYYFYKHKKRAKCGKKDYYLALDVWLDTNKLDFCFHIIRDLEGNWINKSEKDINTIEEINNIKNNGYEYMSDDNYYEKKVQFKDKEDLNDLIKKEIQNLFSAGE